MQIIKNRAGRKGIRTYPAPPPKKPPPPPADIWIPPFVQPLPPGIAC